MKILIVSDTHRYLGNLQTALEEEGPVDMLIHLGDIEHQMADVIRMAGCPVHMIAGNNDFLCNLPEEEEFEIGSYHVWITHGHRYGVSFDTEEIKEEARILGADIVMFGHTHRPHLEEEEDLITLNPGSMTYPRQSGRQPSSMVMTLDEEGKASFEIKYL